ncbi:MAG TPA: C40 family peptidase [Woeseiaceae bacterium]|nr:C40 family peptidase [Woeseiaceae bacterium]
MTACASAPPAASGGAAAAGKNHSPTTAAVGDRAAAAALQQIGAPYRYGGQTPAGFDCSGLVHYAYLQAGKSVPRTTGQLWQQTDVVRRADIERGDLIFFAINGKMQHVGIYVGDGRFVHAPKSGRNVAMASLDNDFYRHAYLRAGRPR